MAGPRITGVYTVGKLGDGFNLSIRIPKAWESFIHKGDTFKLELHEEGLLLRKVEVQRTPTEADLPQWARDNRSSGSDNSS